MRRRQLKRLWVRLKQLSEMILTQQELLMKLGAARSQYLSCWRLVEVQVDQHNPHFTYRLRRDKLKQTRRLEGRYLLCTNLTSSDPAKLWRYYLQLTRIEEAFRNLKGDLAIRPIYHQREVRIEAHIFIAFLAYYLHVTLAQQLQPHAPGLTPHSILEKFATVQMIDVEIPTTDGRTIRLIRYTEPPRELKLLLERLHLELPAQPPPKITATQALEATHV